VFPNGNELVTKFSSQRLKEIRAAYDRFDFSNAVESILGLVAAVDKYLVLEKPWALAQAPDRL